MPGTCSTSRIRPILERIRREIVSNFPADAALTLREKRVFSVCSVAGSRSRDYQSNPHFQCGIALRAFSVWDALRFRPYGLSFREKTRSCRSRWAGRRCARRLAFCLFHRQNALIPLPLSSFQRQERPIFHLGRSHFTTVVFRQTSTHTACPFAEKPRSCRSRWAGRGCVAASRHACSAAKR